MYKIFFFLAAIVLVIAPTGLPLSQNKILQRKPLIVFHIDLNSAVLKESYLKKWLRKISAMGYNAILWEVEGKIKWKTCPECVDKDAFSKKEFKDILRYADSLELQAIPLLQTLGHAEYVLRHRKYFSFREDPKRYDCYAACKPEVIEFIKKWIKEYSDLFGKVKYFHLGGDEAYVFASSPLCSREAKKIGKGRLYAQYMKDIAGGLIRRNIRPCIWSDMIMHYTDALPVLPKSFVIWDWNYWDGDGIPKKVRIWEKEDMLAKNQLGKKIIKEFPEIIDEKGNLRAFYTSDVLKHKGFDVVLCSASRSYGDGVFAVIQKVHASNIIGAAKKVVKDSLLGNCVTSWAVRVPNYETQAVLIYLAPLTIKQSNLSHNELISKSLEFNLGISDVKLFNALDNIGYAFPFVNKVSTGIMWTGMKDSRPAPPGYIKDLIAGWKNNNGGKQWQENVILIRNAPGIILKGINEFNKFIPQAKKGSDYLYAWERAGYFQYWGTVIAGNIVNSTPGILKLNSNEIIELLKNIKSDYNQWANYWLTSNSAEQNTGLIYNAIINFFSKS